MSEPKKPHYRPRRPTDHQIVSRALEMLNFGILASDLPDRLIEEFWLTPERAYELADRAIEIYKKPKRRSRLDTKSLDKSEE
jgi:hypothetical protein